MISPVPHSCPEMANVALPFGHPRNVYTKSWLRMPTGPPLCGSCVITRPSCAIDAPFGRLATTPR